MEMLLILGPVSVAATSQTAQSAWAVKTQNESVQGDVVPSEVRGRRASSLNRDNLPGDSGGGRGVAYITQSNINVKSGRTWNLYHKVTLRKCRGRKDGVTTREKCHIVGRVYLKKWLNECFVFSSLSGLASQMEFTRCTVWVC
ncbi:uncharacterized protein LOC118167252 isoform X2 [Oxyura jamaicensis]|uniref:uncharacterized protein LOC118167252 isoform X2 n=1 Tax=Oxyura jamaicensis TaxID=8884 RepID=UPI0015A5E1AE|nr:uncharacterized protein LOC118167252 isoform X2 [Oxyura jamaicensis]